MIVELVQLIVKPAIYYQKPINEKIWKEVLKVIDWFWQGCLSAYENWYLHIRYFYYPYQEKIYN